MSRMIATGLGIGYFPVAPGTVGSAAAFPIAYVAFWLGGFDLLVAIVGMLAVIGFIAVRSYIGSVEISDPPEVVIDEIAGQLLALLPVAFWWGQSGQRREAALVVAALGAFVLFRIFDIWKPSLIHWADQQSGAFGIMLDDIFAGLCAAAIVAAALVAATAIGLH